MSFFSNNVNFFGNKNFFAIVPAGGSGTRLWPVSTKSSPKFMHDFTGSGQSMLADTFERLNCLPDLQQIIVVTGVNNFDKVSNISQNFGNKNLLVDILAEPSPKDSAAAIALGAALAEAKNAEAIVGSFAADHKISNQNSFNKSVAEAISLAEANYIVTVGVKPTFAATGFGYIHLDNKKIAGGFLVDSFKEKPDIIEAEKYFSVGGYFWNAGIFIAKASVLLDELLLTQPVIVDFVRSVAKTIVSEFGLVNDFFDPNINAGFDDFVARWSALSKVAIDYVLAEPVAKKGGMACVVAEFEWEDIGSFKAVSDSIVGFNAAFDDVFGDSNFGNCFSGDFVKLDSSMSTVVDKKILTHDSDALVKTLGSKLIAVVGAKNIAVIETEDVFLVVDLSNSEEVKRAVDILNQNGLEFFL